MFTPKINDSQTKKVEIPSNNLASKRSMCATRPFHDNGVKQEIALQQKIGNQSRSDLSEDILCDSNEQERDRVSRATRGAAPGVSFDFSKIYLFSPDEGTHSRTVTPMASELASKLARNPEESPTAIEDEFATASLAPLDTPAFREREGNANSSMRVTSAFAGSAPTFTNVGFAVNCKAPLFALAGQIAVPPERANGDLTVGFMQALVDCTGPTGHYYDNNDGPYMSAFQPYAPLPVRDADPGGIFYGPEAQQEVDTLSVTVSMSDQPQGTLLWKTPDKKGTLQQIVGEQKFVTWLATKGDSTGKIKPLNFITWSVDWFAAVDQAENLGTPFGVGRIIDAGAGEGPMTPIRSGPVANSSAQPTQWKPWT
jgi:hypothetical protein